MTADLLSVFVDELAKLFQPVTDVVKNPILLPRLLAEIGAESDTAGGDALATALSATATLVQDAKQLAANPSPSFQDIAGVLAAVGKVFEALRALSHAGGPAAQLENFGTDLADFLVASYLMRSHPLARQIAALLTLVELDELQPPAVVAGQVVRGAYCIDRFHLDRISDLLGDPVGRLRAAYATPLVTVADANAMADKLFPRIRGILRELDVPCRYGFRAGDEPLLGDAAPIVDHALIVWAADKLMGAAEEAGVVFTLSPAERGDLGLLASPFGALQVQTGVGPWAIELDVTAGVEGVAYGRHGVTLLASPGTAEVEAKLTATLEAPDKGPAFVLGSPHGSRIEVGGAILSAQTTLSEARQSLAMSAAVSKAAIVIAPGDGDGFLQEVLPAGGLHAEFDLGIAWSNEGGIDIGVKVGGSALSGSTPVGLSIGPVRIDAIRRDLRPVEDARGSGVTIAVGVQFTAQVGPVAVALDGPSVGVDALWSLKDPARSLNLGVVHVDGLGLRAPTGAGLAIDAGGILTGGGFLLHDLDRYAGALHVRIADTIDLAAWGVLQTGSATQHWSLVVILAGHIPPVELGWNFRLTGLGGLLALHRRMDIDALSNAAYGVTGCLDDLLFPDSPETRFPQLLATIDRFFPPATGSHVAGPMVEIEWGRGAVVNARIRAALVVQLDGSKVALYGTVRVGFPTVDSDSTLRIRAGLEALFDPRDKLARFSITILEAKLFQSIQFTGGAAFLVRWGSGREFAFTIGGFHPAFRPYIPAGLIEPPRVGVHWNPVSGVRLDLTQYFAITSTSMQFGAAAHAEVGYSWGKVTGDLAYDVLVVTSPALHLEADLHARVTVSVFGADLLSAGLDGSLVGPGPWVFSGNVTWKVWIFGISKSFQLEWGDRVSSSATPQSAGQILGDELTSAANWTSFRTRSVPVKLRSGVTAPLAPRDELEVRQSRLPFDTRVETMEGNPLFDPGVWTLTCTSASGIAKLADVTEVFPERRFLAQPSKERPFRGGLTCGARLGRTDWDISTVAIAVDSTATDDIVVDGGIPVPGAVALPPPAAAAAIAIALPATAAARAFTRGAATLEVVR
jgi:hypothetical protein